MDIKEDLLRLKQNVQLGKVDLLLLQLSESDKEALLSVLNDLTVSTRSIARILAAHGHRVGRSSIDAWRHTNVSQYHTRSNKYMGKAH